MRCVYCQEELIAPAAVTRGTCFDCSATEDESSSFDVMITVPVSFSRPWAKHNIQLNGNGVPILTEELRQTIMEQVAEQIEYMMEGEYITGATKLIEDEDNCPQMQAEEYDPEMDPGY